eukprot:84154_1
MANTVPLLSLVSASRDLANRAGILIRHVFETGNLHIIDKSMKIQKQLDGNQGLNAKDPQTIADIAAQQLIQDSLLNTFPGISVIGEEDEDSIKKHKSLINPIIPLLKLPEIYYKNDLYFQYLSGNKYNKIINQDLELKDICIWIDPIDGTKEYTEGIKNAVTCLIGIAYKGHPIAGIINRPFSNQTIFGFCQIPCLFFEKRKYTNSQKTEIETKMDEKEEKEYDNDLQFDNILNMEKISSINILTMEDFKKRDKNRRIVCCSRSHLSDKITDYIKKCDPGKIVRQGGAGGKVLMILEGHADSYVHFSKGTKKWDTCAPQACLECVGGILSEPNGTLLDYSNKVQHQNSNGIIATWCKD